MPSKARRPAGEHGGYQRARGWLVTVQIYRIVIVGALCGLFLLASLDKTPYEEGSAFFQNDQPITAAHKRPCIMIQPLAGGIQEASSTLPAPRYPLYVTTVDVGCLVYLKW